MSWSIFYADGSRVDGRTRGDWNKAPGGDVQVVRKPEPYPEREGQPFRPWRGVDDRQLWTGTDEYSINGWPPKTGSLIPDGEYEQIWEEAAYGPL